MSERMLPFNLEAEFGVLGSLIIDPEVIARVVDFLRPNDFYRDANRIIYETILQLYEQRIPADFITICDVLERQDKLEAVGGPGYVDRLINQVPTSGNVEYYGHIVERTGVLRRLIHAGGQIAGIAYQAEESSADLALSQAEELIFAVRQSHLLGQTKSPLVCDGLATFLERLDQLTQRRGILTGVPTGFTDLDRLLGGLQRSDLVVLAARPSVGKCLPHWTLIDDPFTGERITIEECIQRRQATVYGLSDEGKIRPTAISDWIDSGIQPCYRIRTKLGRTVETTEHHPLLTVQGWKPLSDLSVGSHIAIPTNVPTFGTDESWPFDLVRLLAYFLAEGGLTDGSPEFTNTDPHIVEDFKAIIGKHFPTCVVREQGATYITTQPRKVADRPVLVPLLKNPVTSWLRDIGLWGKLSREKYFPACVWMWSKARLAEFLRILMSCDGCIYSAAGKPYIEFTVASKQLASDLQHAFTRFGIISRCCDKPTMYNGKKFDAWRVSVTHAESVRIYQKEIGWIGQKAARFAEYTHKISKRGGNHGHAPKETWQIIQRAAREQGLSLAALAYKSGETTKQGKYSGYHAHTNQSISRNRLKAFADTVCNSRLHSIASPDIYWDEIVSIEPIGEHHTYDLTVPDGANFIAQDIVVHNSACALSIAHNAAVRYQQRVGIFSLEMSQEQMITRFVSMDAGVDQQRLRTGWIEDDEWERIIEAISTLSSATILIDDTAGISALQLRSKARQWVVEYGELDLIIVDYLQLMRASEATMKRGENRVQIIDEIATELKGLARELNIPILALAQLSRAVEQRHSKVPQLSDLRESGAIENTADVVMFIYRDELYNPETERRNQADILVAKHRNGPIGEVTLYFERSQTRFRDLEVSLPVAPVGTLDESTDE